MPVAERPTRVVRGRKTICLSGSRQEYEQVVDDPERFRNFLDRHIKATPELFPPEIRRGYRMKDLSTSRKTGGKLRRIELRNLYMLSGPSLLPDAVSVRPPRRRTVPPFLRKFAVPYWAIAEVFGRSPMYWYRLERSLGWFSLGGTTVSAADRLPRHLVADEKHSTLVGEEVSLAATAGGGCCLGMAQAPSVGTDGLTAASGVFRGEVHPLDPRCRPEAVNIAGWQAT